MKVRALGAPFAGFAALCASWMPALGQERPSGLSETRGEPQGLDIGGSVRLRYETIDGQFRPGRAQKTDAVLIQTDLRAEYDTGPVRIGGEIMDSRAYGEGANSSLGTGEVNGLAIVQAYLGFDLGEPLGAGSDTRIEAGRITMDFGSRRLVARNNYRNTTNAFIGFRARYRAADGSELGLFYTLPVERRPGDPQAIRDNKLVADRQGFDLAFWGAFASTPLPAGARAEGYFYGLDEEDRAGVATRNRHLRTPGARLVREPRPGSIDYELEGAWQFGTIRESRLEDAPLQDVSAYFVHAELGYRFATDWSPRVALEYDRASGDREGGSYNRFDTLYGARRFDFGPTSLFGALGRTNISSPGVRIEAQPSRRWGLMAMYRAAWAESAQDTFSTTGVIDASGEAGRFAGHQIETMVRYWLVPDALQLEGGGAVLVNGRLLEEAATSSGNGDTLYGYFSVLARF